MPGDAPPDIFLRFSNESGNACWHKLRGESADAQNPGEPYGADDGYNGWFLVTSFHFSISAEAGSSEGGGAAGSTPAKGKAGGGGGGTGSGKSSDKGLFKGVNVTLPFQYGCVYLMKECTKWAQKHQEKEQHFQKIPKAQFVVRRAGLSDAVPVKGSGQAWFLRITLQKVTVEDYAMSSACEQETFTLNYEDMEFEYRVTDPDEMKLITDQPQAHVHWSNNADEAGGSDDNS